MAQLEGFICPLCKEASVHTKHAPCSSWKIRRSNRDLRFANFAQVLAGVLQLEAHVREEHPVDTVPGRMKSNFKQFIGKAKTTFSKKKV